MPSWIDKLFARGAPSAKREPSRRALEAANLRLQAKLTVRQNALRASEARRIELERRLAERTEELRGVRRRLEAALETVAGRQRTPPAS